MIDAKFQQARFLLNREFPFLAHLVNHVPPRLAPVGTARTRDRGEWGEVFFDPEFAAALSVPQLATVWAHEVLHLAFGFFRRRGRRELRRFNEAHDHVVNLALQAFMARRPGVLAWTPEPWIPVMDRAFAGMSAEEIYERLEGEPAEGWAADCEPDPEGREGEAEAREHRWRMALAEAVERETRGAGTLPAGLERWVEAQLRPEVPWAERLLRALEGHAPGGPRGYARLSRRGQGAGVLLPGRLRRRPRLALVVDTSASIGPEELAIFLGVVRRFMEAQAADLRLVEVDAEIQADRDLDDLDDLRLELRGGGGTCFDRLPAALAEHPELEPVDLALLLTDGAPTRWPPLRDWPCQVVVATVRELPPEGYPWVRLGS